VSGEEVTYTPVSEFQIPLPSVASPFEPRPVCLRRAALESDFVSVLGRMFDSIQA